MINEKNKNLDSENSDETLKNPSLDLSYGDYVDATKKTKLYKVSEDDSSKIPVINYKNLVENYLKNLDWRVKENSTVTYSIGGLILSNSGAITANY